MPFIAALWSGFPLELNVSAMFLNSEQIQVLRIAHYFFNPF